MTVDNRQIAKDELNKLNALVKSIFGVELSYDLRFDLKGISTIGQCRKFKDNHYIIRLHKPLMEYFGIVYLKDVLLHEVSHAVQMSLYKSRVKPHGKEWRHIVSTLQDSPYSAKNRPSYSEYFKLHVNKNRKKFKYECCCEKPHFLSLIRHNRATKRGFVYTCKICKKPLIKSKNG